MSATAAALPIFVLLILLGIFRKPAWIAALSGLGIAAAVVALARISHAGLRWSPSSSLYGAAYGLLPIGWIVFTAMLLYRLTRRNRKIRNHQGLDRQPHQRPALAGAADRLRVRRVYRRRGRIRNAGRRRGGDADGARLQTVLRGRHLPAGEHVAGSVRIHRDAARHAARPSPVADGLAFRRRRPHLRAGVAVRSRVSGAGDGRHEGAARRVPGRGAYAGSRSRARSSGLELCRARI